MSYQGALRLGAGVCLTLLASGCGDDDPSLGPQEAAPQIAAVTPGANMLTVRVSVEADGLDSVRVRYSEPLDGERSTPAHGGGTPEVIVAGLRANATYRLQVEGWRNGAVIAGDSATFATDSLPAALRSVTFEVSSGTPSGGYTMLPVELAGHGYLVAFDSTGTIRWYFDGTSYRPGAPADHKQLPNGHILMYLGATRGFDPIFGEFVEVSLAGDLVRTYAAPPPLYTDNHDIQLEFADSVPVAANYFSYDFRTIDLTPYGGAPSVAVAGHQIIRQRMNGTTAFFWNAWDHFSLLDWIEEPQSLKQGPTADFDHPNSLDRDAAGNYVVSWRSMGEVTKIDARTGAILWRWGGLNNQFTFVNDGFGLFSGQHSVRVLPNGNYLLYDNGIRHAPPETRMAEYQLDESALTATLVWEYRHTPAIFTAFVGNVARLQDGNTFIGWGGIGTVQEVRPDKTTVWEARVMANGAGATFYRAFRVPDLYRFRLP